MKKWLLTALLGLFSLGLHAQDPYPALGAKLQEYFTALSGEPAQVQNTECDYLIASCQDSLVRQYVALKIYDHYLHSKIMGDDAVAVHVARKWFLSKEVPMKTDTDLLNAQIFVEFNQHSLIGQKAPVIKLFDPSGAAVSVPAPEQYSVLYFYDTGCATCKVETPRLQRLAASGDFPVTVYAIYVGADSAGWEKVRAGLPEFIHLWDPEISSDWQRLYGILKTPGMFLVNPSGTIVGRGLDTSALQILLNKELGEGKHVYGEASQMELYGQLFTPYGDSLSTANVMEVADYLAARTFGEGDIESFKQVAGDLLYYLSSQKKEAFRDACKPFVQKYLDQLPDVWNTEDDKAQVLSLGHMLVDLASRTPAGSLIPDLTVHGTLLRKPCLLRKGSKEGVFQLRKLKGDPAYLVFYTSGCTSCQATLEAVDALVAKDRRTRILLIDMDALLSDYPEEAGTLLDSFDLSALPFVLEMDKKGIVKHRYVQLN